MAHLPPPPPSPSSAHSPLLHINNNNNTGASSPSSSNPLLLASEIDIDRHQYINSNSYPSTSFSSPSSDILLPSADPFSPTPTFGQQQPLPKSSISPSNSSSLFNNSNNNPLLPQQQQQQRQQSLLLQQQQQGIPFYPASHINKQQQQQSSQPQPPQQQLQGEFEQQRLALQQHHLQAQLQVQRIQLQQRKRLLDQQQQTQQQLQQHSSTLTTGTGTVTATVIDTSALTPEVKVEDPYVQQQKVFASERHHSAPSLQFQSSVSQPQPQPQAQPQPPLIQQLHPQQQQQHTFPLSSLPSCNFATSSFPAVHPLHPLYALHPLQFSYPTPPQQQQHLQLQNFATFPSNPVLNTTTPISASSSSSIALPTIKSESTSSNTTISSMGVLTMPPFSLHSHHHNPFTSSSSSTQQQQQAHSTRHHSFPSASSPTTDHFQLFQRQQQQQLSSGQYSSTASSSGLYAQTHISSPAQSQQQPLHTPSSSVQQHHTTHPSSVSPSTSTVSKVYFGGMDNDMTPTISALDISQRDLHNNNGPSLAAGETSSGQQQLGGAYLSSWAKADSLLSHRTLTVPGDNTTSDEIIRRLSHSSAGSEMNTIPPASTTSMFDDSDMIAYSLEARIIQKKDQLEELSATGTIIPAPMVEEVRTGQQFLIKIHLSKNNGATLPSRFPALRVGRREAINTAGEARSEPEPLTLEIAVHLAKSGQTRKGACAKCCHKYGPSSPILVLLDPLSPSVTDPTSYAHVDTTSGSITMLAKVLCSSTDHGERGNKDKYIFEFRLKSTSSMPLVASTTVISDNNSPRASEAPEDEGDTVSSCFTQPIMCSGHHKAKRVYPHQRPIKTPKGIPTPKTKTIKRHKSVPTITMPPQGSSSNHASMAGGNTSSSSDYLQDSVGGSMSSSGHHSGFSSAMSFLSDPLPQLNNYSHHPHHPHHTHHSQHQQQHQQEHHHHHHQNDLDARSHSLDSQGHPFLSTSSALSSNNDNSVHTPTTSTNPTNAHGLSDPMQQLPYPKIIEVRPDHGPIRKATDVVLRGLAFREGMVPYFGCFPAQDIIVETSNLMVCKAPESPLPGTVAIAIYDHLGNSFSDLGSFTYTDDCETELLILQLQLRLAHRALEYMHTRATGQKGNAADILKDIPGLATSPRSGNVMMDAPDGGLSDEIREAMMTPSGEEVDEDMPLMSLAQIEESILNTLDNVPRGMDISVQLDDGTNMLHLAILLGLNYLAVRLIEEGCDIEAQDAWSMTPLMYAVLKSNEAIARILIIAGATSSGASTPQEFYARLPRTVEPTQSMYNFLSVSCTRFSGSPRLYTVETSSSALDSEMTEEGEEEWTETSSDSSVEVTPSASAAVVAVKVKPLPEPILSSISKSSEGDDKRVKQEPLPDLATAIQGVRTTPFMPPLDEQDLPPLHMVEQDGSVTINTKVIQGADIYGSHGAELFRNVNPESGYHTGVYSEVEEQLNRLHLTTLPSQGVEMEVALKKLTPSSSATARQQSVAVNMMSSMPELELFRTGDSFGVEIRLKSTDPRMPMPKEFLGLRFPHEMIKRVSGRPASILTEMTYIMRASVELGKTSVPLSTSTITTSEQVQEREHVEGEERHYGDGIPLTGSCQACSKFLHEHKKLSPSRRSQTDPSVYPVLQFNISGASAYSTTTSTSANTATATVTAQAAASSAGVVEMRDGVCEVKAKVNCSSMHHLIQREKARRTAELKLRRQQEEAAPSPTPGSTPSTPPESSSTGVQVKVKKSSSLAMAGLQDPGFVFKFEVVHPVNGEVVARTETKPILFQSYSRGRS